MNQDSPGEGWITQYTNNRNTGLFQRILQQLNHIQCADTFGKIIKTNMAINPKCDKVPKTHVV